MPHPPHPDPLGRRTFIKIGALGVAAGATGCTSGGPEAPAPPASPGNGPGSGTGGGGGGPSTAQAGPPAVTNLVDPPFAVENWQEPWVWRPELWPDSPLELNVVQHQSPFGSTGPGNPRPSLFSYNGIPMGPTVRVRSDGSVRFRVRNHLGLNEQASHVGPSPDPFELPRDLDRAVCERAEEDRFAGSPDDLPQCFPTFYPERLLEVIGPETRPGWSLKGHLNGQHRTHTTNLHTHGLHVPPQRNPDGSHSDNVLLRIIPRADMEARLASGDPELAELAEDEHVAELDYHIQLPIPGEDGPLPHPPGTHWYHPHSHGATHDQVSSGMAGFLIVEGDVDEAVNRAMTGESWPDPAVKTGPWDYRERLLFLQRVNVGSVDLDAGPRRRNLRFPAPFAVNGTAPAAVIAMRPGAVERWRVLNGSVDGAGTKRFMVLEGQFVQQGNQLWRVVAEGTTPEERTRRLEPVTEEEIEAAKMPLHQLSFDGITLVTVANGRARHRVKDLSLQNADTRNPLARRPRQGESPAEAELKALEDCYRDGDALRRAYVRPNELYLGNANRADVFFQPPTDGAGKVYTIFAKEAHLQTDNRQSILQMQIGHDQPVVRRPLFDVVMAYVSVRGEPVEGGAFDPTSLDDVLPPVPDLLQPISAEELRVPADEARVTGAPVGSHRTRTIAYSGTGGTDWPLIDPPEGFCDAHPELENLVWGTQDGRRILLPNLTRTMAINTDFDLADGAEPRLPRKFMPEDPYRSTVLVDTAEEWVLYNNSQPLWSHTDLERFPQTGSYLQHYEATPMVRAEGQRRFWEDPEFQITTKASDHPFHIHINPMWVLRIDVPDENGTLHNVLPEPRWMDTVPIPRDGGRVVFRTRFDDYTGTWVHHCHILLHEDMGMMQAMVCVDDPAEANYRVRSEPARHDMSGDEVSRIYPPPSRVIRYRQNLAFVDPNELGGQTYPGFSLDVPIQDD